MKFEFHLKKSQERLGLGHMHIWMWSAYWQWYDVISKKCYKDTSRGHIREKWAKCTKKMHLLVTEMVLSH